ncbi:MHS family proline/betaine transporter-like MFS transporter OS=Streptomyces albaduncus OX=68172 GN=FHS32_006691 PE=4 SV=1 [Streptomyces griseoloalbus]
MIMMAAGTFAIGLIPSYAAIGVEAPILLLAARLVQGFSTGGECAGASTFIAELRPRQAAQASSAAGWSSARLAGYIGGGGHPDDGAAVRMALLSTDDLLLLGAGASRS